MNMSLMIATGASLPRLQQQTFTGNSCLHQTITQMVMMPFCTDLINVKEINPFIHPLVYLLSASGVTGF